MNINFDFERNLPKLGIYGILNIVNNKLYIGSSINLLNRMEAHRSLLRGKKHYNQYLQNSFNKYEENSFIFIIIEYVDTDKYLEQREQYWIDLISPKFNLCKDVKRHTFTKESKEKLSKTRKRLFKEGKIIPNCIKQIDQYDLNGNFLNSFDSIYNASIALKIDRSVIRRNLNNKYLGIRSKYIFKYNTGKYISSIKVPFKKSITRPGLYKAIYVTNITNNSKILFNSIKECAKYFKVSNSVITSIVKSQRIYKSKFEMALVKSDKLLEHPEEDNQQPT